MFLQVAAGPVTDGERLRRQWDRWATERGPAATGWLGTTGGVTPDGRGVVVHRWSSAGQAGAGIPGAEEAEWWSATRACLGNAIVRETHDVTVQALGDQRDAGFVQVMVGTVASRAAVEEVEAEIGPAFMAFRPDFLTGFRAWFPDGTLAAVDYFRSEAEARAGEGRPMPAGLQAGFGRWLSLVEGAAWYDLPQAWHASMPD